jgi:hypothetical protein
MSLQPAMRAAMISAESPMRSFAQSSTPQLLSALTAMPALILLRALWSVSIRPCQSALSFSAVKADPHDTNAGINGVIAMVCRFQ